MFYFFNLYKMKKTINGSKEVIIAIRWFTSMEKILTVYWITGMVIIITGIVIWLIKNNSDIIISMMSIWLTVFAVGVSVDPWKSTKEINEKLDDILKILKDKEKSDA